MDESRFKILKLGVTNIMYNVPVLFLVFNRPKQTKIVFNSIRKIKPSKLYVACDGTRSNVKNESERVAEVRDIILRNVDWDCKLYTLFQDKNLGCKEAVSRGISWFFENEKEGIILEDDCLPSESFFIFCGELLNFYRNDDTVMHISGYNHFPVKNNCSSYYFSKYPGIWGWATWRSAWEKYDRDLLDYNDNYLKQVLNTKELNYWDKIFKKVKNLKIDTWDYQWTYTLLKNNYLSIRPNCNLVQNIGIGDDATHTKIRRD